MIRYEVRCWTKDKGRQRERERRVLCCCYVFIFFYLFVYRVCVFFPSYSHVHSVFRMDIYFLVSSLHSFATTLCSSHGWFFSLLHTYASNFSLSPSFLTCVIVVVVVGFFVFRMLSRCYYRMCSLKLKFCSVEHCSRVPYWTIQRHVCYMKFVYWFGIYCIHKHRAIEIANDRLLPFTIVIVVCCRRNPLRDSCNSLHISIKQHTHTQQWSWLMVFCCCFYWITIKSLILFMALINAQMCMANDDTATPNALNIHCMLIVRSTEFD